MLKNISYRVLQVAHAIFLGIALYKLWKLDWLSLFVLAQAAVVVIIPYVLEKRFNIFTPYLLRIGIVVFMFGTLILGEIADFYNTFQWWDLMLHGAASVGLTVIGFMLLVIFFRERDLSISPAFTSFLALSFTLSLAVLWEIYEFFIDMFFHPTATMQPSNGDTMWDLIISVVGAGIVVVGGYRYVRWKEKGIVAAVIEEGKVNNEDVV
ncbi:hypothetical protein K2X96_01235 [Patescibacteria group bacterium]|nr:hypothetical protein [Patescibacteria group bacterium]